MPAPSMEAASSTDGLTFWRPAWKITTLRPSEDQIVTAHHREEREMRVVQPIRRISPQHLCHHGGQESVRPQERCQIRATATELVTTGAKSMTM